MSTSEAQTPLRPASPAGTAESPLVVISILNWNGWRPDQTVSGLRLPVWPAIGR